MTSTFFSFANLFATRKYSGEWSSCQENTNYGWNLSAFLIWHVFVACFILLAQFSSSKSMSENHRLCIAQNMDAWLFGGDSLVTIQWYIAPKAVQLYLSCVSPGYIWLLQHRFLEILFSFCTLYFFYILGL